MDLAIAIRTLVTEGDTHLRAGGRRASSPTASPPTSTRRRVNKARAVLARRVARCAAIAAGRRSRNGGVTRCCCSSTTTTRSPTTWRSTSASWGRTCASSATTRSRSSDIAALAPARIVISPGPCTPNEAGISLDVIRRYAGQIPILGVCLGHQAIGQAFGGNIVRAARVMHGKTSKIFHDERGLFAGLPQPVRGHALSLAGDRARQRCPTASRSPPRPGTSEIMGVRHKTPCAGRRRAVPPGVDPDHGGQGAARATSSRRGAARERSAAGESATRWRAWSAART